MALFPKDCLGPQGSPQTQPNWPEPEWEEGNLGLLPPGTGDENPGIWFIYWGEVEQGGGARMGSSLKEGC